MKTVALILALVAVAFAGCTGGSPSSTADPTATDTASTSPAPTSSGPASTTATSPAPTTSSPPAEDNAPPVASLNAVADGLNVTVNVSATDPDGDDLTWSLDLGDGSSAVDGSELPSQVNHTFLEAGNYTIVLTVSDGIDSAEANVTLNVTASSEPIQSVSTEWTAGFGACAAPDAYDGMSDPESADGVLYGYFTIDPLTYGLAYTLDLDLDGDTSLGGEIDFFDADGGVLDGGDLTTSDPYIVTGTVPAAAAYALVYSCGASGGSATYVAG